MKEPVLAPRQWLRVHLPARYEGQSNGQVRETLRVLAGGIDRTASVIDWI